MHLFYYQQTLLKREESSERRKREEEKEKEDMRERITHEEMQKHVAVAPIDAEKEEALKSVEEHDPLGLLRAECEGLLLNISPPPDYPYVLAHDSPWARLIYAEDLLKFHQEQYKLLLSEESTEGFTKADRRNLRARLMHELDSLELVIEELRRVSEATSDIELLRIKERWGGM